MLCDCGVASANTIHVKTKQDIAKNKPKKNPLIGDFPIILNRKDIYHAKNKRNEKKICRKT